MHAALRLPGACLFTRMIPIPTIHRSPALINSIFVTSGIAQDKAHLGIDSLVAFRAADFPLVTSKVDASSCGPVSHTDNLRPSGIPWTPRDGLCGFLDRDEVNALPTHHRVPSKLPYVESK